MSTAAAQESEQRSVSDKAQFSEHSSESDVQEEYELTEEEKELREIFMRDLNYDGLLPINLGALFMPAIWGPAHGVWITILYYPIWLLADNLFYGVYTNPQPLTIGLAVLAVLILAGVTIVFACVSQGHALRRALENGQTKEQYRKRQAKWAVAMAIVAAIMIVAATYYNLVIRPTLGA